MAASRLSWQRKGHGHGFKMRQPRRPDGSACACGCDGQACPCAWGRPPKRARDRSATDRARTPAPHEKKLETVSPPRFIKATLATSGLKLLASKNIDFV